MQTSTKKSIVLSVLIGFLLGVIVTSYIFFKSKDRLLIADQEREAAMSNTDLSQEQIQNATALTPGRMILGTVVSKETGNFTMETKVENPIDAKNSPIVKIAVPFNSQKDEVIVVKQVPGEGGQFGVKEVEAAFADIKVGQQILLQVRSDKNVIYLSPS